MLRNSTEGAKQGAKQGAAERSAEVRKEIDKHVEDISKGYIYLCKLLHEAQRDNLFSYWGYETIQQYAYEELGFKERKTFYFISLGRKLEDLGVSSEKLQGIGWTKAKEIIPVLTAENADDWFNAAATSRTKKLIEDVKKARYGDDVEDDNDGYDIVDRQPAGDDTEYGDDTEDYAGVKKDDSLISHKLIFLVQKEEGKIITDAVETAKKLIGTSNPTNALELICQDWLEIKGAKPSVTSVIDIIQYVKKIYGVHLIAKDNVIDTDEISDLDSILKGEEDKNLKEENENTEEDKKRFGKKRKKETRQGERKEKDRGEKEVIKSKENMGTEGIDDLDALLNDVVESEDADPMVIDDPLDLGEEGPDLDMDSDKNVIDEVINAMEEKEDAVETLLSKRMRRAMPLPNPKSKEVVMADDKLDIDLDEADIDPIKLFGL
jgi:hypothetical protein